MEHIANTLLMDSIRAPWQRFVKGTLENSTHLTADALLRVHVSIRQPDDLGTECIVEQAVLVRAG